MLQIPAIVLFVLLTCAFAAGVMACLWNENRTKSKEKDKEKKRLAELKSKPKKERRTHPETMNPDEFIGYIIDKEPVAGEIWARTTDCFGVPDGSPWPRFATSSMVSIAQILDCKNGWVRYSMGIINRSDGNHVTLHDTGQFSDQRADVSVFKDCYYPVWEPESEVLLIDAYASELDEKYHRRNK